MFPAINCLVFCRKESNMQLNLNFEQQKNAKAIGITVGVHLLLLLFFLFYKYTMPVTAPPIPMGLEVNLGTTEDGFGTDQPEAVGSPADLAVPQTARSSAAANHSSLDQDLMTSQDKNAAAISINEHKNRPNTRSNTNQNSRTQAQKTAATTANAHKTTTRKPKYTYAGSSGNGQGNDAARDQQGGSEGIGKGTGDMGVPGGTPGASNYKGVPGGYGNMTALVGNRFLVAKPNREAKYKEGGRVVIKVTVNRDGVITDYHVSSAANSEIRALALQKLKHVKFNKAPNARPEEFGTITFNFNTH